MRQIGTIDNEQQARLFGSFLYATEIDNDIDRLDSGEWAIWIHKEKQLEEAGKLLEEFKANPDQPKYMEASKKVQRRIAEEEKKFEEFQKKMHGRETIIRGRPRLGLVTAVLIGFSIMVFASSNNGNRIDRVRDLLFVDAQFNADHQPSYWHDDMREIRSGEVWRTITPIFIHFGWMHIIFNMLIFSRLGSMIESRVGSLLLLFLVLFFAISSNTAEFMVLKRLPMPPIFGGMSGVVYGLLGYIWMRSKHDPSCQMFVHKDTFLMAIIWFFACLIGLIPNVANMAHAVGLGMGLSTGYLAAKWSLRSRME